MADRRNSLPFEPRRSADGSKSQAKPGKNSATSVRSQPIPKAVANRMARRVVIATGIPSIIGMGVFVASYFLVSRQILDVPPGVTLIVSGGFFLLGLGGLSYGVLSASWEQESGTFLGLENIKINFQRMRESIRTQQQN